MLVLEWILCTRVKERLSEREKEAEPTLLFCRSLIASFVSFSCWWWILWKEKVVSRTAWTTVSWREKRPSSQEHEYQLTSWENRSQFSMEGELCKVDEVEAYNNVKKYSTRLLLGFSFSFYCIFDTHKEWKYHSLTFFVNVMQAIIPKNMNMNIIHYYYYLPYKVKSDCSLFTRQIPFSFGLLFYVMMIITSK